MALGELLAVRTQNHGDVCEGWNGCAQSLVHHNLTRSVGQVVIATNDVGNAHASVINNGGKVIGWGAIRTEDDKVIKLASVKGYVTVNSVVDNDVAAVQRNLDTDGIRLASINAALCLCRINVSAGTLIALEGVVALFCGLLVFSKLLWRAEARVCLALCQQFICCLTIQIKTLGLAIRTAIAALIGTLVPIKAKPLHSAQNNLSVLFS